MKRICLLILVGALILVSGCSEQAKPVAVDTQLAEKLAALEEKVLKLQSDQFMASLEGPQEIVWFDPQDDKKYQPVRGPAGPILVILEKVEPYLDGFTVHMRLGNPSAAGYTGFTADVKWGRQFVLGKEADYYKLTDKKIEAKEYLAPGSWTTVKFNVAPATADQVRRIGFAPLFNSLSLRGS